MIIEGKNAVKEALLAGKSIERLYVLDGYTDNVIQSIINMAKDTNTKISFVDKRKLDKLTSKRHQNVVAEIYDIAYTDVDDIINFAKQKGEKLFMLLIDNIEDPHNLGSIIRSAEIAGVHGIVIPKIRACGITESVIRVSAGASYHIKVARVVNINDTIRYLKDNFINVYATDTNSEVMYNADFSDDLAIIIGNEGKGVKTLTKKLSDKVVSIPQRGNVNSLNASVACGVVLYEVIRQRNYNG